MIRKLFPIILLTFVNVVGFSVLFPVLPDIAEAYAPEAYRGIVYGSLISAYAACQFLAAPILGSLSDKYGRKPILLISQLGTTVSWLIFGTAYFVPEILVGNGFLLPLIIVALSRVVDGVTGGNISVAQAWISDSSSVSEKTKAFGIMGATFGMGFLIGPAIGGLTNATPVGYLGTAIFSFVLSFITLVSMYVSLPESLTAENRDSELHINFWQDINVFHTITLFKDNALVFYLLIMRLFFALVFASVTTLIVLILEQQYGLSSIYLGLVLSVMGLFGILNQAIIVHRVADRIGDLKTIYASFTVLLIVMILIAFLPGTVIIAGRDIGLYLFIFFIFLMMLGTSLGMPTFKSVLTSHAHPKRQGMITGVDESLLSLGQAVTPIIAGGLYTVIGPYTLLIYAFFLIVPHMYVWVNTKHPMLKE
jgi:MFS family permease